ncbi:hypothetical protein [Deinococcus sp. YIM 77859]|uniref:hypothetical protein n=1 Tax=Deinococcus sp. YIM 77859 TaxID=1540221 RepID=UPI0012E00B4C|nr:hypothetical protein [Deinococcus sp. YIM 77859]
MRRLAGGLLLGLLTACAPAVTPRSNLAAQATVQGRQLTVSLVNLGPYDVLLEDRCPRPFTAGYTLLPAATGRSVTNEDQPCLTAPALPQRLRPGERVSAALTLDLPAGTYTLQAWARPKVRLVEKGKPADAVRTLNVATSALTLTLP